MMERFFPVAGQPDLSSPDHLLLLSGPPSSGKSSLLFQFAINAAAAAAIEEEGSNNNRGDVVFICNRRKLETNPPFLSQGIDPSSQLFQRIHMKYVDDDEGIKNYFAAFHLLDTFPVSVVIDDFGDFFDERICRERYSSSRGRDVAMIRILALSQNAIAHANGEAGRQCQLLISDTHLGDSPRLLYIYKRWVSSIYTIKGNGFGSFVLRNSYSSVNEKSESNRTAKYSIALQYLVLEAIAKDEEN